MAAYFVTFTARQTYPPTWPVHLSVKVAYAPTEEANDADKDTFYNDLASVTESVPVHDNLLLLGDFNAVTGPRSVGYEDVVGSFGSGTPNNNSLRLLSFCSSHGVIIPGSWFRRLDVHRWTWASNDGRTKKEIDHIITRDIRSIKSYRVFRGAEVPAKFAVQPQFKRRLHRTRRFDVDKLRRDPVTASTYGIALDNRFQALPDLPEDIESTWTAVRDSFRLAAEETLGYVKPHKRPWLTSDTLEILEKKSLARRANNTTERKRLQGIFRAKAKADREAYFNSLADEAEAGMHHNDLKPAYKVIKRMRGVTGAQKNVPVTRKDGQPCSSQQEVFQR